jgi:N-acetylmuramoyl-L-alanine amidase
VATSNTPITSMRSAQRTPTDLRVVIDLKKAVTPKASPWRRMPSTATAWWSTCTTRKPTPSPPATRPPRGAAPRPRRRCRSPRPSRRSSCHRRRPASATSSWPSTPATAAKTRALPARAASTKRHRAADRQGTAASDQQREGFRAELTRTGDYFIPLRKRTEIARKKGADLFVSIHADAAPSGAFGASVFALSDRGATSETARWLADTKTVPT